MYCVCSSHPECLLFSPAGHLAQPNALTSRPAVTCASLNPLHSFMILIHPSPSTPDSPLFANEASDFWLQTLASISSTGFLYLLRTSKCFSSFQTSDSFFTLTIQILHFSRPSLCPRRLPQGSSHPWASTESRNFYLRNLHQQGPSRLHFPLGCVHWSPVRMSYPLPYPPHPIQGHTH